MNLGCPQCRRVINVPDERAQNPNLKIKCSCGLTFPLSGGLPSRPAGAAPTDSPSPTPTVAPQQQAPTTTATPAGPAPARVAARPAGPSPSPPASPAAARPGIRPPATPAADRPPAAPVTAAAGAASVAPAAAPTARRSVVSNVRVCAQHPRVRSEHVCPACKKGNCAACVQLVRGIAICSTCEGLCIPIADHEAREERERLRSRSLMSELGAIVRYPLTDPLAYVLLSIIVGVFAFMGRLAMFWGGMAFVLSQGLLMAYAFNAVTRVSSGQLSGFIPELSDISDIVNPVRLGFAAFVASNWPLILVVFLAPGAFGPARLLLGGTTPQQSTTEAAPTPPPAEAAVLAEIETDLRETDGDAGDQEGAAGEGTPEPLPDFSAMERAGPSARQAVLFLGLLIVGLIWKLVYSPVALTVAALNRTSTMLSGMLQTLNPVLGLQVITTMGGVYWQAMAIYAVVAIVQVALGSVIGMIPIVGTVLRAFVDAYALLVIGCALGFAVFKKARELNLD